MRKIDDKIKNKNEIIKIFIEKFFPFRVLKSETWNGKQEEKKKKRGATHDSPQKQVLRESARFRSVGFSLPVFWTLRFLLPWRPTQNRLDRFQRDPRTDPGPAPTRSRPQLVKFSHSVRFIRMKFEMGFFFLACSMILFYFILLELIS